MQENKKMNVSVSSLLPIGILFYVFFNSINCVSYHNESKCDGAKGLFLASVERANRNYSNNELSQERYNNIINAATLFAVLSCSDLNKQPQN